MAVSKRTYLDWKQQSVTEELIKNLSEAIEDLAGQMVARRDSNPLDDQYLKGWIQGLADAIEWVPEFIKEEDE